MYSDERAAQLIVALLKKHGIRKMVASPGTTNYGIVGSSEQDPFFEVYSSVDERSAAYIACGMAAASGEPVVLSCTGATASREYLPGLTEAFYRKLPVIAITSFNGTYNVGQLMPQNIDRRVSQSDVKVFSVDLPVPDGREAERFFVRKVNEGLLACKRHGGGPVHLNVTCDYSNGGFGTESLPECRLFRRHMPCDDLPSMDGFERIAVHIGAHVALSAEESAALEAFVCSRNAAVLCDHTSNYHGERGVLSALVAENSGRRSSVFGRLVPDLIIDLGEVSGDYVTSGFLQATGAPTWRVSEDGELRDRFCTLTDVFEMGLEEFCLYYIGNNAAEDSYFRAWQSRRDALLARIGELPFTNRWISKQLAPKLPEKSVLHMSILNSLRSWNYWDTDSTVDGYCNTGGFGIDGAISTALGSALSDPSRLNFLFCGDLAFFYDMNTLGSRHLPGNLRILLVNNGMGVEFRMPYSPAAVLGRAVDPYIAASGHFRNQFDDCVGKPSPAQAWCEALGITYYRADDKAKLLSVASDFVSSSLGRPIVLECMVAPEDEEVAAGMIAGLDPDEERWRGAVRVAKKLLPATVFKVAKRRIGK